LIHVGSVRGIGLPTSLHQEAKRDGPRRIDRRSCPFQHLIGQSPFHTPFPLSVFSPLFSNGAERKRKRERERGQERDQERGQDHGLGRSQKGRIWAKSSHIKIPKL